jgi:hypothetical protein
LSACLLSRNIKVKIYKTIILPVVLYGCETLSLALRDEHKLRMYENRKRREKCTRCWWESLKERDQSED